MADKTLRDPGNSEAPTIKYKDVGDGTWAMVLALEPGSIGGGGTQYTEDAPSVADPVGGQLMTRRRDTLAVETTTDGDVTALNSTGKGELYVKQVDTQPISGTITANQGGSWTVAGGANVFHVDDNAGSLTVDGSVSILGAVDTELTTGDLDTGVGTDTRAVIGLVRAESGGGVLVGSANPLPVDTELPAAVALADNMANPTVPQVGSHAMVWDAGGANWDRENQSLTDTQLRATAVPENLTQVGGAAVSLGQKVMASSVPVVVASDQSAIIVVGDVDHDAVNTLKNIQIAGHATPVDLPPAAVSAVGDRVRAHFDRYGANVVRRRKIRESYTAVYRLAETAARLDQTFTQVANTNKQWATIHHAGTATKEIRLQRVWVYITADTTVGIQGVFELRELSSTTAPATGNPAITPRAHRIGTGAAEATCLYLPTTQGSEAAVNSPLGHVPFDTGISGAVSTSNPVPILTPVVLFDSNAEDDEVLPPTAPVGAFGGWAVVVRTVGAPVLRLTIVIKFTEEIP